VFGQGRNSQLMRAIDIPLGMLIHKLSLNLLSVGLLGTLRAWRRMTIILPDVHPIVTRGSTFGVCYSMYGYGNNYLRDFHEYHS
jgi:hypothetical protein